MARAGIFHEKYRKNTPRAEILEYPENTKKNTEQIPKMRILVFWGYFWGIFGVFWGSILGVRNFGPGVYFFSVFFVEIPARAISGLCSRLGRSQGKRLPQIFFHICFRNEHVGRAQATTLGRTYNKNTMYQRCSTTFFSSFPATPRRYRAKNPGISCPKVWFPWVLKDIPNFLDPTHSRARPPPHRKISGPKRSGFFLPELLP